MVEQRPDTRAVQPWMLSRSGLRLQGHDHDRRLAETRAGLTRHSRVRSTIAQASADELGRVLSAVHEPDYLRALAGVSSERPVLMDQFAAPGMTPDTPVCASIAAAAHQGVRTAIAAATVIADGERFAYALCRPPGHHAGPGWSGGGCFLNNAAAAADTLRKAGLKPVAILDLDIHYPNGTAAIAARMTDTSLDSLHAWPVVNLASQSAQPCGEHERVTEFRSAPADETYLAALAGRVDELSSSARVVVLSLGYDTVTGDPHGGWSFSPGIFARIGRVLADSRLPLCIVQEGGYLLDSLAQCSYAFACGLLDCEAA